MITGYIEKHNNTEFILRRPYIGSLISVESNGLTLVERFVTLKEAQEYCRRCKK